MYNDLALTRRNATRLILICVIAVLFGSLIQSAVAVNSESGSESGVLQESVPPREGITVVTAQGTSTSETAIIAYAENGSILYYNDSHFKYFDVDPVTGTKSTVEYVAVDNLKRCITYKGEAACKKHSVIRVNLSTNETSEVFSRVTRPKISGGWHDVDRLGPSTFLVAGIVDDRVFIINTTTGLVEWQWNAHANYPITSGGRYPSDWTHLNDVERVAPGRYMVSLRNQDQVVFLDRESGLDHNWTLGEDDNHSILFEQHNPDYIPREQGGPAILIGDSENNRIVEYQRSGDRWVRSWVWTDVRTQWPRDADRLPNGHTLIADSNGNRVVEVDKSGDVIWEIRVRTPYDVERLGTGDESRGGQSAMELNLTSTGSAIGSESSSARRQLPPSQRIFLVAKSVVPELILNGILFVMPSWMSFIELAQLMFVGLLSLLWAGLELFWAGYRLRLPLARA